MSLSPSTVFTVSSESRANSPPSFVHEEPSFAEAQIPYTPFTQPAMYKTIAAHPTVRASWAATQQRHGQITADEADAIAKAHYASLEQAYESLKTADVHPPDMPAPAPRGIAAKTETGVPVERLRALNDGLLARPDGFTFHKKLERAREKRRQAVADAAARTIDWATAEELAFASILADGIPASRVAVRD